MRGKRQSRVQITKAPLTLPANRRAHFDALPLRCLSDMRAPGGKPSPTRGEGFRAFANALCIPCFCDRASCKRAKQCRGDAARCLARYSQHVPREVREFVIDLMVSRELGFSFEEALRRDREGLKAFVAWDDAPRKHGDASL